MQITDAFARMHARWSDELVVCSAGSASRGWYGETRILDAFYLQASMGLSSMFALGLALTLPQARVWNLDGDGALCMNPGALLTEAEEKPSNMVHFVVANRVYGATALHPFPSNKVVDFEGLARASGIRRTYSVATLDALDGVLDEVLEDPEFAFVVLEIEEGPMPRVSVPIDSPELKYRFARHIERTQGVSVLGKGGY